MKNKSKINRVYNLHRDKRDHRDHHWNIPSRIEAENLPPLVDHTPQLPPTYDQGQWGTCYANAVAGVVHGLLLTDKTATVYVPSRLFIAWNACAVEGSTKEEDGIASLRDTVDPLTTLGFTGEVAGAAPWPYTDANLDVKPVNSCFTEAAKHLATSYERVNSDLNSIKAALAEGHNIIFGIAVYPQFESQQAARDGIISTPGWFTRTFTSSLGGHAIVLIGYDDAKKCFKFRNSWGRWGDKGCGYLSYDYVTNDSLAYDFWVINALKNI